MKDTLEYENGLTVVQERKSKVKNPKIMVDNNTWIFYKEELFTTAVKAANWIKKNNLKNYNIWFKDEKGNWHIVMYKENETITIKNGYAIPKVLTDLVRWKGDE